MIETPVDVIVRAPWGRYTTTGSSIVWCASRALSGAYLWGRPKAEETRAITRLFDEYPRVMHPTFDMILDTRAVEGVDGEALVVLTSWMWANREVFAHARIFSVIREAPTGFLLAGLLPAIAHDRTFHVATDPAFAFAAILGESAGPVASEEIEAIALRMRGVPRELQVVRAALARRLDATIEDVAKDLHLSARSLQRSLSKAGTTFHDEVIDARMTVACELLLSTDLKVAAIASRLGISERAVTMLFRDKTGITPIEWRKKHARDR